MATDALVPGTDEPDRKPPQRAEKGEGQGFFTIYKKGQGYWTRVCSYGAAALIILLTANFIWTQLPPQILGYLTPDNATGPQTALAASRANHITIGVCIAWIVGASALVWHLMNKPTNVDFLIATDSEMKKVNWTSRQELIGSTKVVIVFMLMIAVLLFTLDMYFTHLFYKLSVLKGDSPLWIWAWEKTGMTGSVVLTVGMTGLIFGGAAWAVYETIRSK